MYLDYAYLQHYSQFESFSVCFVYNQHTHGLRLVLYCMIFTCVAEGESSHSVRLSVRPSVCPSVRPKILSSQLL